MAKRSNLSINQSNNYLTNKKPGCHTNLCLKNISFSQFKVRERYNEGIIEVDPKEERLLINIIESGCQVKTFTEGL